MMRLFFNLIIFLFVFINGFSQKNYLVVGTYTTGKSEGIYVYVLDENYLNPVLKDINKLSNPSYLTVVENKYIYAVSEKDTGMLSAFKFENEKLVLLNKKESYGKNPCYISNRKNGNTTQLFVGHYSSGNFSIFNTSENGIIMDTVLTKKHFGKSVNTTRQNSPHVHATVIGNKNKNLYVTDLGTDKIMIYKFDSKTNDLKNKVKFAKSKPGSGPRHITFHPTLSTAYLIEELTGTIVTYKVKKSGSLKFKQRISSHPTNYNEIIGSADIHITPDGSYLYASNRGNANNLAIYQINKTNGMLTNVGFQSTLGIKPRNFIITPNGEYLMVANQESGNIVVFKINKSTGILTPTGTEIKVPNPVSLQWIIK